MAELRVGEDGEADAPAAGGVCLTESAEGSGRRGWRRALERPPVRMIWPALRRPCEVGLGAGEGVKDMSE